MAIEILKASNSGYGLATANILYRLPDHPNLLQNFIWQTHDLYPHFPEIRKFLDFWVEKIEGGIHSVLIAHKSLINPAEFKFRDHELTLH